MNITSSRYYVRYHKREGWVVVDKIAEQEKKLSVIVWRPHIKELNRRDFAEIRCDKYNANDHAKIEAFKQNTLGHRKSPFPDGR